MTKTTNPIDSYLAGVSNPEAKKTLTALRAQLRKLLPTATETISYGMPAYRLETGKVAAGFAFSGKNCGYYPHVGNVVAMVGPLLGGFKTSSGAVSFPPGRPLKSKIVKALVRARLDELKEGYSKSRAAKGNAIIDRVGDDAVKDATGRDWKGWLKALDRAGVKDLSHKEIVAHLKKEGVSSGWWQQSIAVAYEHARGIVVGQTADTGFQIGVQKTLRMTADDVWELLAHAPERWLGEGSHFELAKGEEWELPARRGSPRVAGVVRVVAPGKRVRMTWHPEGWKKPALLQLTVMPTAKTTSLRVHMEKLPDAKAREAMKAHWRKVLDTLEE